MLKENLLPSFNLVSRGKECKSCSAYIKTKQNHMHIVMDYTYHQSDGWMYFQEDTYLSLEILFKF